MWKGIIYLKIVFFDFKDSGVFVVVTYADVLVERKGKLFHTKNLNKEKSNTRKYSIKIPKNKMIKKENVK